MLSKTIENTPRPEQVDHSPSFPENDRGKEMAEEIILINGDVPRIIVRASEAVLVETERREGGSRG
jgi:hypothetical protein